MNNPQEKEPKNPERRQLLRPGSPQSWLLAFIVLVSVLFLLTGPVVRRDKISRGHFVRLYKQGMVKDVQFIGQSKVEGTFGKDQTGSYPYYEAVPKIDGDGKVVTDADGEIVTVTPEKGGKQQRHREKFYVKLNGTEDDVNSLQEILAKDGFPFDQLGEDNSAQMWLTLASVLLPLLLILFFFLLLRRTRDQIMGGGFLSGFSKSPAKEYEEDQEPITFADVAGLEGVKADLQEIIEFLKNPAKFQRLGGRVPKGVLLNGPPGTGKTLLARAVAGEAGVPFYSVNGSEFIQMFVGVGASRVRDLFGKAKEAAPGIIFIDEIDAVGRQRGAGLGGGHDEREQTLNQILSEMDGFEPASTVIVVAATNRPDVLDPALLRPGRFDRHITVDRPTLKGRKEMFKVHVRDVPLSDDVDIQRMAEGTVGMTGADIRNLVNEAALWAARHDKKAVDMEDFEFARDKILMGAKREEFISPKDKEKTAYHEAGHALVAWLTEDADRVHKVTVIPRGRALGVTQTLPDEDQMSYYEGQLEARLAMLLAGRAAEKIVYDEYASGAANDLERATGIARTMVTKLGMSEKLGPVSYKLSDEDPFLGREMHQQRQFSEATMEQIDAEVVSILNEASKKAMQLLTENRSKLDAIAEALVKEEELSEADITELIGPSVHANKDPKPTMFSDSIATQEPVTSSEELSSADERD